MTDYPRTDLVEMPRKPFVSRKWFRVDDPVNPVPRDGTPFYAWVYPLAELPAVCWFEKAPRSWGLSENERSKFRTVLKEVFETEEQWKENWVSSWYEPTHWLPIDDAPED